MEEIERQPLSNFVYLRRDGEPRNYIPPEIPYDASELTVNQLYLRSDIDALKKSQRWVSLGIIAVGGAIYTATHPPEDVLDFVDNFVLPTVIQLLSYSSFRKGINLMRHRASLRIAEG